MSNIDNVLAAALRLPVSERAAVIARLLDSLDEPAPSDVDVEQAWVEEAQRRLAEVDAGGDADPMVRGPASPSRGGKRSS